MRGIGVPDARWGEAVIAFAVCRSPVSEEDVINYCRERLANYKVPKGVVFIDSMPKNSMDKILKRELRTRYTGLQATARAS